MKAAMIRETVNDPLDINEQVANFCRRHHLDENLPNEFVRDPVSGRVLNPLVLEVDLTGKNLVAIIQRLRSGPVGGHESTIRNNAEAWLDDTLADLARGLSMARSITAFCEGIVRRGEEIIRRFEGDREAKLKRIGEIEKSLAQPIREAHERKKFFALLDGLFQAAISISEGISLFNEREVLMRDVEALKCAITAVTDLISEAQYAIQGQKVLKKAAAEGKEALSRPEYGTVGIAPFTPQHYHVALDRFNPPDDAVSAVLTKVLRAKPVDEQAVRDLVARFAEEEAVQLLPPDIIRAIEREATIISPSEAVDEDPLVIVGEHLLNVMQSQPLHPKLTGREFAQTFCYAPGGQPLFDADGLQTCLAPTPWQFGFVQFVSGLPLEQTCSGSATKALERDLQERNVYIFEDLIEQENAEERSPSEELAPPAIADVAVEPQTSGNHSNT